MHNHHTDHHFAEHERGGDTKRKLYEILATPPASNG